MTYEFKCPECGEVYEIKADNPEQLVYCRKCGATCEYKFSNFTFQIDLS